MENVKSHVAIMMEMWEKQQITETYKKEIIVYYSLQFAVYVEDGDITDGAKY